MSLHTRSYDLWVVYIDVVQHCTAYKKQSSLSHHELSCTREPTVACSGLKPAEDSEGVQFRMNGHQHSETIPESARLAGHTASDSYSPTASILAGRKTNGFIVGDRYS